MDGEIMSGIVLTPNVYNKLVRAYKSKPYEAHTPTCFLLAGPTKGMITTLIKIRGLLGHGWLDGCEQMPGISTNIFTNAILKAYKLNLIPQGLARISKDSFSKLEVEGTERGVSLWDMGKQNGFILSWSPDGIKIEKMTNDEIRNLAFTIKEEQNGNT